MASSVSTGLCGKALALMPKICLYTCCRQTLRSDSKCSRHLITPGSKRTFLSSSPLPTDPRNLQAKKKMRKKTTISCSNNNSISNSHSNSNNIKILRLLFVKSPCVKLQQYLRLSPSFSLQPHLGIVFHSFCLPLPLHLLLVLPLLLSLPLLPLQSK